MTRPSRTTLLLAGLFGALAVLHGSLEAVGEETLLRDTGRLLRGVQGADSWRPMVQAHALAQDEPGTSLYDTLFFGRHVKFLYPPTALLWIELLDRSLPRTRWLSALAAMSWLLVLGTLVSVAAIVDCGLARAAPPVSRADRALRAVLAVGLSLLFYPVVKAYSLGQAQVLVNACVAGLVWAWLADRRVSAGVLLAVACAIKPQLAWIAVWGLARGEWRFLAGAGAVGALLLCLSVVLFGWVHHPGYLEVLAHVSRLGEAYLPNQSPGGLLHRLLANGVSERWDPSVYPPYHPFVHAGTLLCSGLLLLAALWRPPVAARGSVMDLCVAIVATLLASPIAWEHHHGLLLPVFGWLLASVLRTPGLLAGVLRTPGWGRFSLPGLAVAFVLAGAYLPAASRLPGVVGVLAGSHLLWAALAALALALAFRRASP